MGGGSFQRYLDSIFHIYLNMIIQSQTVYFDNVSNRSSTMLSYVFQLYFLSTYIDIPLEGNPLPTLSLVTAGAAVAAIFRDPDKYLGQTVKLSSDCRTIPEYCDVVNRYIYPKKLTATKVFNLHNKKNRFLSGDMAEGAYTQ